jgi:tetrahydromethanopterin S-methyltransferase subunit G
MMEAMRESWTDARLDDFAAHTDRRFDAVDRRFDALERRMEAGFGEMNARFDTLQRTLFQLGGGVIVALIGLVATQL